MGDSGGGAGGAMCNLLFIADEIKVAAACAEDCDQRHGRDCVTPDSGAAAARARLIARCRRPSESRRACGRNAAERPSRDRLHRFRPVGGIRLQHALQERTEAHVDHTEIRYFAALLHDLNLTAAHIERLAGERLHQHQTETVDVRFCGHFAAKQAELFRRHVVLLASKAAADNGAFVKQRGARDAEVDDLGARDVAARHDDVVGRDVAMNDAALVCGHQAGD